MKILKWIKVLVVNSFKSSKALSLGCFMIILQRMLVVVFLFMLIGPLVSYAGDAMELIQVVGEEDIVKVSNLLTQGADVNAKGKQGMTALMAASMGGNNEIVKILLAQGADVNAKNDFGTTALMAASGWGRNEVVKTLLVNGADVNIQRDDGVTALIWASGGGHNEVVKALLAQGANVNSKDKKGKTALMYATSMSFSSETIQSLKNAGAKE